MDPEEQKVAGEVDTPLMPLWFLDKYRDHLSRPGNVRWDGFSKALNLFTERGGQFIVETGCTREPNDWGAGYSTVLFADFARKYLLTFYSVDNNPKHIGRCEEILGDLRDSVQITCQDSVDYLKAISCPIDLLYLDSYDYPDGKITLDISTRLKVQRKDAYKVLGEMSDEEALDRYEDLLLPCQTHARNEFLAAEPNLHGDTVLLVDDNDLAGGGKTRLLKKTLEDRGWKCLLDTKQTLWTRE